MELIPVETELKLALPLKKSNRLLQLPLLESLCSTPPKKSQLYSIYFDTPDFLLKKKGIAFRLRHNGECWMQTIKDQGQISAGLFQHREWEIKIKDGQPNYAKIADSAFKQQFSDSLFRQQIRPVFVTKFTRILYLLHLEDGSRIKFCLDRGKILTEKSKMPLCELELELEKGSTAQLFQFALTLQKKFQHALRLENASKAERGYLRSSGRKKTPVNESEILLTAKMCMKTAFKTIYWNCLTHFSSNEYGMLHGRDYEYIVQMYIALKKQRIALKIFYKILSPKMTRPTLKELDRLIEQFNLALTWGTFATAKLPTINQVVPGSQGLDDVMMISRQMYRKYYKAARRLIQSNSYLKMILKTGAWLHMPEFSIHKKKSLLMPDDVAYRSSAKDFADALLNKQHLSIQKSEKRLDATNHSDLHILKTRIEQQIYTIDFFKSLYPIHESEHYRCVLHQFYVLLAAIDNTKSNRNILQTLKTEKKDQERNEAISIIMGWNWSDYHQMKIKLNSARTTINSTSPFWSDKN